MSSVGSLPDGLMVVLKQECDTCTLIVPALDEIALLGHLTVVSQDDPNFPAGHAVVDDRDLELSWELQTEVTPTLYRIDGGQPSELAVGWRRSEWREVTGVADLGESLPDHRPGCGSRIFEPEINERLAANAAGEPIVSARIVKIGDLEDVHEAMFERGWSDGLPLIPPTRPRVAAMVGGSSRSPDDLVAMVPPNFAPATVEKVATNAVMAGCRPEYFPIVLTAVEAICTDNFNIHGVAATTYFSGPVIVVNGPIGPRIGMNSGFNALGPGNRANATIGRAVNLVVRNVGGSVPGGVDRSMQGHPAKWTLCFAEREEGSPWESLAQERGIPNGTSAVTVFAGQGPTPVVDQISRSPDSLARTLAAALVSAWSPKGVLGSDALVTISPEHARVFGDAGWSKADVRRAVLDATRRPIGELIRGAGGVEDGLPADRAEALAVDGMIPKFLADGLWFVRVGSEAGLFSGIISGWTRHSTMVTLPIAP